MKRVILIENGKKICLALVMFSLLPFTVSEANAEVIRIGGTGGALGTMKEMARAFQKKHRGVRVTIVPSLGSSGGIKALLSGALDIAVTSRPLNDEERGQGAHAKEYGRTPFIFVTSKKEGDSNLTLHQISGIYSGQIKAWPDGTPLRLVLRPAGDTDNAYLKGMAPGMEKSVQGALSREGMVTAVTDQDNLDMIGQVKGGFGASTLSQVITEQRDVRVYRLNGVSPSAASLRDGSYPYYKCFFAIAGPHVHEGARSFIVFLGSPEGRAVLKRTGHVPGALSSCRTPLCKE